MKKAKHTSWKVNNEGVHVQDHKEAMFKTLYTCLSGAVSDLHILIGENVELYEVE